MRLPLPEGKAQRKALNNRGNRQIPMVWDLSAVEPLEPTPPDAATHLSTLLWWIQPWEPPTA